MTYTMAGPVGVARILAGLVASLGREFPAIRRSQLLRHVQDTHAQTRGWLPDLGDYATAVARIARADLAGHIHGENR
jgi:hypothetical protein